MHNIIKRAFPAAVMVSLCLAAAFPAYAEEPAGKDVTVVEEPAGKDATVVEKPVGKDVTVVEETESGSTTDTAEVQASHKARASVPSDEEYIDNGPGAVKEEEEAPEPEEVSLGTFTITGYCSCGQCSGGHCFTYSGTVPRPDHTVSADLDRFSLGTRLRIDGVIYTVEDKGSSVNGNILDIFYGTHEEALAKGTYTAEVFLVEE